MKKDFYKFLALSGLLLILLAIDVLIKAWVNQAVFSSIVVWNNFLGIDFYIQHVTNLGGAWGMFAAFHKPLIIIRLAVIFFLIFYLFRKNPPYKSCFFIVLILAGAIGNVVDAFIYGHVIDMFHFVFWGKSYGIFNFADALIFSGALSLMFTSKKVAHAN